MKKDTIYILYFLVLLGLSGCTFGYKQEDTISAAMKELYRSNFTYVRTDTSFRDGKENVTVYEGRYTCNPYAEHIIVNGDGLWQEAFYYGEGDVIYGKVKVDGIWQETSLKREYFLGYNEDVTVIEKNDLVTDGIEYTVYDTKYEVEIKTNSEPISAVVKQQYYIEKENDRICHIVSELTDLQGMAFIANDMSANGRTLEEARQNAENADNFNRIITIWIEYMDEEFQIEVP